MANDCGEEADQSCAAFDDIRLFPKYQPIVSVTKGRTIGFEGLIRGTLLEGFPVLPKDLFDRARRLGRTLELDRKCREVILRNFTCYNEGYEGYHLFVNIDTSILEAAEGSNYLLNQVEDSGIDPENIVIEICESRINDTEKLLSFVSKYRGRGFLIALDDLGTGFSNLERIPILKPDIIKLDRSLIRSIEKESYKQECLKSLVRLANNIGAVVVAEGVETEMEAYIALEFGTHLLQGFFFSRPEFLEQKRLNAVEAKIAGVSGGFKKYMKKKIREDKNQKKACEKSTGALIEALKSCDVAQYDSVLRRFVGEAGNGRVECAYILNGAGRQISSTVFSDYRQDNRKKLLFYPASVGTDHSLKEYYYRPVNTKASRYYSEPYISMATGNVCVTLSISYRDAGNVAQILCVDYQY
jgi:EAL domain-containing protein (putative c-di-GMP-specific phosphodiesterase class I)